MDEICQELHEQGFQRHGWERMYNGATGLPLPALIFIGPCYYQRLKHMVDDKYHSRSTGITQTLTRQPTEGRSKEGGLRSKVAFVTITTYVSSWIDCKSTTRLATSSNCWDHLIVLKYANVVTILR